MDGFRRRDLHEKLMPADGKIIICGAHGFIGRALAAYFSKTREVAALGHGDFDVTDRKAAIRIISAEKPELIINCAVLGVDACERDPAAAHAVNVSGAENLAIAAERFGAELLQISTNYVFDGRRKDRRFYTIDDDPNPVNAYGSTKSAGERAVQAAQPRSYIVRTSWVFGRGKENFFCRTPRLLKAGEKVQAITDVRASTTYLPDLVARIAEIVERRYFGTYHVVNHGICSYYNFAVESARILKIEQSEWSKLITPVTQDRLGCRAIRPASTPMRCLLSENLGFAPLRDWPAALADYILQDGISII